jgi:hypothetical protein
MLLIGQLKRQQRKKKKIEREAHSLNVKALIHRSGKIQRSGKWKTLKIKGQTKEDHDLSTQVSKHHCVAIWQYH